MKKVKPNKTSVKPQNHTRKYRDQPSYAIPVWNGILEHREKIGPAIWEFFWCLDKITVEDENDTGWLLGKTPIDTKRIADDLSEHENTAHANMNKLAAEGYIIRKRTPRGYLIGVVNSRKFSARKSESQKTVTRESQETVTHQQSESQETVTHSQEVNHSFQGSESQKTVIAKDFTKTIQNVQGDVAVETDFARNDFAPLSQTLSPENPTPERERLKEWATNIILKRAPGTIRNPQAFLKTSLDEFFQNLPAEVESYLAEQAKAYVDRAMWDAPDLPISFLEVTNLLDRLRDERDLPLSLDDPQIVDRILDSVKQANPDTLVALEPCGFFPSPKWQSYRHGLSTQYPIPGWKDSRTAVSGYIPSSPGLGTFLWSRPAKLAFDTVSGT